MSVQNEHGKISSDTIFSKVDSKYHIEDCWKDVSTHQEYMDQVFSLNLKGNWIFLIRFLAKGNPGYLHR